MVLTARDWLRRLNWLQLIWILGVCGMQLSDFATWWVSFDHLTTMLVVDALCLGLIVVATLVAVFRVLGTARLRYLAITSQSDLMPRARHASPVISTLSLAGRPLEMLWLPRRSRAVSVFVVLLLALTALVLLGCAGALFVGPWLFPSPTGAPPAAYFAGGLLFLVIGLFILAISRPLCRLAFARQRRIGIVADEAGLHEHRLGRPERHIRWEDARLLEVATGVVASSLTYTVFAPHARVSWTMPPNGLLPEEVAALQAKHDELLALLKEHTHLEPRTVERGLRADFDARQQRREAPQIPAPGHRWSWRVRLEAAAQWTCLFIFVLALSLFFVGLLLVMAWACVSSPLTGIPLLDDYAAAVTLAPLAIIARLLLGFLLASRRREVPLPYLPPAPTAASYEFRWRLRPRTRIGSVLGGMVLVPAGALGVAAFARWSAAIISPAPGQTAPPLFLPIAIAGTIVAGMFGSLLLWRGVTGTPHSIRADARGLIYGRTARGTPLVIPWDDIKALTLTTAAVGRASFTLRGCELGQLVDWPAHISVAPAPPSADGTQPLTPAELAALVSARAGLSLGKKG